MTIHSPHKIRVKTTHFSNKIEINIKHHFIHQIICHQMMTIITNQIFLHHTHTKIVHKNLDKIEHPKTYNFTYKIQLIHKVINSCTCKIKLIHKPTNQHNHRTRSEYIFTNQHKCKMKYHYHIFYNNMK